ncbi:MAG: hypothetical protein P1U42_02070 [Phycisphaerales bacterium]|nr:hypothetical protein [Phycisphaerales bacterium]
MAETIVSTLIIGFVLVGTLQIIGPMIRSSTVHANKLIATNLANELMEEIITKKFTDPDEDAGDLLGVDTGERAENRNDFDDIDDYQSWTSTPPKLSTNQTNTAIPGWTRSVKIVHVEISDPSVDSASATGLKKITVTVSKDGTQLASIVSLQSSSADSLGFASVSGG